MTYRHAIIVGCLALVLVFALPSGGNAKVVNCTPPPNGVSEADLQTWIRLQVPIPGITTTCTDDGNTTDSGDDVRGDYVKDMGAYIGGLYKYFVGVIGIIAAVMVFYGGLQWLTAGGNASHVKNAKDTIFAALIAILIAFGSYTLLYTINPKLVVLNPPVLKVADTFLVSFDNTCSTTKVCLSGTNLGNTCTTDAACPGASIGAGACGLPIELNAGETQPKCGTQYNYKNVQGLKLTSETCRGTVCLDSSKTCTKGSQLGSLFVPEPVNGLEYGCVKQVAACESINDNLPNVGSGRRNDLCQPLSVSGVGLCQWYEPGTMNYCYDPLAKDYCNWWEVLTCPSDYPTRVNGNVCQRESVPNDEGLISVSNGALIVSGSCYKASSGEVLYDGTLASTGGVIKSQCDGVQYGPVFIYNVQGICCMKSGADPATATKDQLTCNVSN